MSTLDQKLGAQSGQAVVFANNVAVALSRQAAERQRQLAEELRAPEVLETRLERADKEPQAWDLERARLSSPAEDDEQGNKLAEKPSSNAHRVDVRI